MSKSSTIRSLSGLCLLLGAAAVLPTLGGCATLTETQGENWNQTKRTVRTDLLEIPDDTEDLLLLRSPSMLSEDPVPIR